MPDRHVRALVCALALALSACSFTEGRGEPDAAAGDITVEFGTATTTADEASTMVTIPVRLSAASSLQISVDYAVTDGSAMRPDDFALADGTLVFLPNETEHSISVGIAIDMDEELDETIVVTLSRPVNASLGAATAHTVTISSDILPRVSFVDATASTAGEAVDPQVTLVLSMPPKDAVTVELGVAGTASTADHALTDGQVVAFAANETSKVVPLGIVQDALDEDDETVMLTLRNPSARLLLAALNTARAHTISDDDPMPTVSYSATTSTTQESQSIDLTVQLSAASGRVVTVGYSVTGGSASSADATVAGAPGMLMFMPGQTMKTISIVVTNDGMDEPAETLEVSLGSVTNATLGASSVNTLTINDDDNPPSAAFTQATTSVNEATMTVQLDVQLSSASGFAITVPFTIAAASTANNPEDFTVATTQLVTIPAGMTSAAVAVGVLADTLDEANETVVVDLGAPTNATLGAIASETLTINDDDASPMVGFTSAGSMPNEHGSNIMLTVQLSEISGQDVIVPFTIDAASTAVNPADYTISPGSPIVIPAGNTGTTITIAMKEDAVDEDDEMVIVALGMPTNATLAAPTSYTLTIRDDDQPPNVSWNPSESNLSELEGTAPPGPGTRDVIYTMVLSAPSARTVTVPILYTGTATSPDDYTGPTSVSFAPGVTSVDVTLAIKRDALKEMGAAETITMTIDSANVTNAGTTNPLTRTYSIQDDD